MHCLFAKNIKLLMWPAGPEKSSQFKTFQHIFLALYNAQSSETRNEKLIEKGYKFVSSFQHKTVEDIERRWQGTEEHERLIEKTYKVIVFGTRQY